MGNGYHWASKAQSAPARMVEDIRVRVEGLGFRV